MNKAMQSAQRRERFEATDADPLPTAKGGAVVTRAENKRISEWLRRREGSSMSAWRRRR